MFIDKLVDKGYGIKDVKGVELKKKENKYANDGKFYPKGGFLEKTRNEATHRQGDFQRKSKRQFSYENVFKIISEKLAFLFCASHTLYYLCTLLYLKHKIKQNHG